MNSSQNLVLNLVSSSNHATIQDFISDQDLILNQDIISNKIDDISICIHKVKEFLQEHSKEHLIIAACIYNLSESTL